MNNGAFGENFPYSNFHDLNMDWIIKIAKDFLDQYTHIQETIENGLDALDEKAETLQNLLQDWYYTHSEDIATQLADALEELNTWYNEHQDFLDNYVTQNINYFNQQAEAKGQEVIASIPEDYSSLVRMVDANSAQMNHPFSIHGTLNDMRNTYTSVQGYIDTEGNLQTVQSGTWSTDFINIADFGNKYATVLIHLAQYGNPNVAVYDGDHTYLGALTLSMIDPIMETYDIRRTTILDQYGTAIYIRVSSWTNQKPIIFLADTIDSTDGYMALAGYTHDTFNETSEPYKWNFLTPVLSNGYLDRYSGNFTAYTSEYCRTTDYIDLTQYKLLKITTQNKYGQAVIVLYDENYTLIHILENTALTDYILDYDYIKTVFMDVKYIRVSSFNIDPDISYSEKPVTRIWKRTLLNDRIRIFNGYIDWTTGNFEPYSDSKSTDFIPVTTYDKVYYYGKAGERNANIWALYNSSKTMIANERADYGNDFLQNKVIDIASLRTQYPSAVYIRICSIYAPLYLSAFIWVDNEETILDTLTGQNILYGKKYVACGDSFTEGPFTGEWADRSLYYDYNFQCWKTYPYWIAKRNNMDLVNEAIGGTTMYFNGTDTRAFSVQRYKDVPDDADYITLEFGLNETTAPIGTIADNTNTTVMGAWNVVLAYLIEHHPYAKIGIIISDSWLSTNVYNAMVEVAEYWGIPYLDMRKGTQVPMGINGRLGETISPIAKSLRNDAFQISSEDGHPNPHAHEYRSTFIENWLRTL